MARVIPPVINEWLFNFKLSTSSQKAVVIPYTCEPDSVGIAIQESSLDIYRVYCTNEHGALDWEKSYGNLRQAVSFARDFYIYYQKFLYQSDDSARSRSASTAWKSNCFVPSASETRQYQIVGGSKLRGEICISGSRNAGLGILAAALLANDNCRIENVPVVSDTHLFINGLIEMGTKVRTINETTFELDCSSFSTSSITFDSVRKIRASYYFMGALLGRFGQVKAPMPADYDDLGTRPIDQHLKGFRALGAEVDIQNGLIYARVPGGGKLIGNSIRLDVSSVGATVNIMLAAALAQGMTVIENAAKEPHIVDVANFLNSIGANITGAGTNTIKIQGVERLHGGTYSIIPDPIEAGTYMAAVAATGGSVIIQNVIPKHVASISLKLQEMGVKITELSDAVLVESTGELQKTTVATMPYPGFPTDMQPSIAVCMALANGISVIKERVFDNRFRYMEELIRLGAMVQVEGNQAVIQGIKKLRGNTVHACDLRAGAAMVIAGLAAEGTTTISDVHRIERGYSSIVEKLTTVGADIKIVDTSNPNEETLSQTG